MNRPAWRMLALTLAASAIAWFLDTWAYGMFAMRGVYDEDWARLLRVMGFMGTWIALAVAVGLHDAGVVPRLARPRRRAWLLLLSPGLAGLAAEILKIVLRRERPALHEGLHGFRPWDDRPFNGAGLALPSSHAAVAFGGAAMLAYLFPRSKWVGYVLAAGCGFTRMLAGAHFLGDVVLAAGIGWFTAWLLMGRPERSPT